jgi:hypothetical protein
MSEDMGILMIGFDEKSIHVLVELGLMTDSEEKNIVHLVSQLQRAEQKITARASIELTRMLHEFFAPERIGLAWAVTQHLIETSMRFSALTEERKAEALVKMKDQAMQRMQEEMAKLHLGPPRQESTKDVV